MLPNQVLPAERDHTKAFLRHIGSLEKISSSRKEPDSLIMSYGYQDTRRSKRRHMHVMSYWSLHETASFLTYCIVFIRWNRNYCGWRHEWIGCRRNITKLIHRYTWKKEDSSNVLEDERNRNDSNVGPSISSPQKVSKKNTLFVSSRCRSERNQMIWCDSQN